MKATALPPRFAAKRPCGAKLVDFESTSAVREGLRAKRLLDVIFSITVLVLCAPLFLTFAVWTWLFSPGPIFFKQERVGLKGRRFMCYKFRTMKLGASTSGHEQHLKHLIQTNVPMTKLDAKGDKRLIPGAWLMRATGLDELPQLINILRGEMSVVGPRPCLPYEWEEYQSWQRARCDALPGLTGLWQVSGKNRTTFEEMVRLDIRYTRTRNFWLDVSIIARTVPALVRQVIETRRARNASPVQVPAAA